MCGSENQVHVFPAALGAAIVKPADAAAAGEATCFDHSGKRAVASCTHCGRFLCLLCSVEFGNETWCPSCIAAGAGRARQVKAVTSRNLFDSIVLLLPLASLLLWPLTLFAAPAALALGIVKWREPLSLIRRNRWRMALGMGVSVLEIAAWIWGIVYLLTVVRMRPA